MATTKPADTKTTPTPEAASVVTDRALLDGWVADVRKRIWEHKSATPFVSLDDRLLAMQIELGRVEMDAVHFQGYRYHSIQSVENHINTLSAIYRVRITPSRVNSVVLDGGVRLQLKFLARCNETAESQEWEWEDDGEDLTKAGSYTQKYGLMKFFHVGDGQDPDAEAERGKPKARAQQARSATPASPTNGNGAVSADAKAKLYAIAKTLPKEAGWPFRDDGSNVKIDAMLKSKMAPENIEKLLREAQTKAGIKAEAEQASEPPEAGSEAAQGGQS